MRRRDLTLAAAVSLFLCGCGPRPPARPGESGAGETAKAEEGEILAEGGGVLITKRMLDDRINAMNPLRRKRFRSGKGRKRLLDSLVTAELLYNECRRRGLDKDKKVLERVETYRKQQEIRALRRKLMDGVKVADSELREEYERRRDRYSVPKRVRVSQIVFAWDEGTSPERIAALKKQAAEIRRRALKGEDFAALAREYSLDQESARRGGDIGFASRMRLPEEVFKAAMALEKKGDISGIVRGEGELRILRASEVVPSRTKSFEEVKPWIERSLLDRKKREAWKGYVEELKRRSGVKFFEERIGGEGDSSGEKEKTEK